MLAGLVLAAACRGQVVSLECLFDGAATLLRGRLAGVKVQSESFVITASGRGALLQFPFGRAVEVAWPRATLVVHLDGGPPPRSLQVLPVGLEEQAPPKPARGKAPAETRPATRLVIRYGNRDLYKSYFGVSAEAGWLHIDLGPEMSRMIATGEVQGLVVAGVPSVPDISIHSRASGRFAPYVLLRKGAGGETR